MSPYAAPPALRERRLAPTIPIRNSRRCGRPLAESLDDALARLTCALTALAELGRRRDRRACDAVRAL
jgi:hypothetical protein